jgi:hypothetical protein
MEKHIMPAGTLSLPPVADADPERTLLLTGHVKSLAVAVIEMLR